MELEDASSLEAALRRVEDWNALPIEALAHALERGVRFPLSGKPLPIEEMEGLTKRLAKDDEEFYSLALRQAQDTPSGWQELTWVRGMMIAAVRVFGWEKQLDADREEEAERHVDRGLSLARAFARTERAFISRYYAPETWEEENIRVLPPMHRFGWYCAQAFDALNQGDFGGCVKRLRAGLDSYQDVAKMVEFLLDRVAEMEKVSRIAGAPPELAELANQVQAMLARFAPGDPAVEELKKSPAYRQVAWMIDEPSSIYGKIPQ